MQVVGDIFSARVSIIDLRGVGLAMKMALGWSLAMVVRRWVLPIPRVPMSNMERPESKSSVIFLRILSRPIVMWWDGELGWVRGGLESSGVVPGNSRVTTLARGDRVSKTSSGLSGVGGVGSGSFSMVSR